MRPKEIKFPVQSRADIAAIPPEASMTFRPR
jgi:hypothetical protein